MNEKIIAGDITGFVNEFCQELERELIAACKERDRYKTDSLVLDWIIEHATKHWDFHNSQRLIVDCKDCPEHLRKRLEGKK